MSNESKRPYDELQAGDERAARDLAASAEGTRTTEFDASSSASLNSHRMDRAARKLGHRALDASPPASPPSGSADPEVTYLRAALAEIALGRGPFSRDPLTHADNCVTAMKAVAAGALAHTWSPEE